MASAAHAHPTGLTDICETFWNDFEHNLARRRYGFDISEAFVSSCAHETIVLEAVRNSKQSKAQRCRKLDVRFVSVDAVTTDTFFFTIGGSSRVAHWSLTLHAIRAPPDPAVPRCVRCVCFGT